MCVATVSQTEKNESSWFCGGRKINLFHGYGFRFSVSDCELMYSHAAVMAALLAPGHGSHAIQAQNVGFKMVRAWPVSTRQSSQPLCAIGISCHDLKLVVVMWCEALSLGVMLRRGTIILSRRSLALGSPKQQLPSGS